MMKARSRAFYLREGLRGKLIEINDVKITGLFSMNAVNPIIFYELAVTALPSLIYQQLLP